VRLPQLTTLQCPSEPTASCTLSGSSLYLIDAISSDPAFESPSSVPDGYTGSTINVPHPASPGTLFLKLRDDPATVNAANIPSPTPAPRPTTTARARHSSSASAASSTNSGDTKSDSATPNSAKPSDSTPVAPETHAHKDSSPQDDSTTPPPTQPPTTAPQH
jgi:hypothetical protein